MPPPLHTISQISKRGHFVAQMLTPQGLPILWRNSEVDVPFGKKFTYISVNRSQHTSGYADDIDNSDQCQDLPLRPVSLHSHWFHDGNISLINEY